MKKEKLTWQEKKNQKRESLKRAYEGLRNSDSRHSRKSIRKKIRELKK